MLTAMAAANCSSGVPLIMAASMRSTALAPTGCGPCLSQPRDSFNHWGIDSLRYCLNDAIPQCLNALQCLPLRGGTYAHYFSYCDSCLSFGGLLFCPGAGLQQSSNQSF